MMTLALVVAACDSGSPKAARDPKIFASSRSDGSLPDARTPEIPASADETDTCRKLVVGPAREPASLCEEVATSYWHVTRQVVSAMRAGKSVTVLDVPTKVEGDDSGAIMLELKVTIARDGMSATVEGMPIRTGGPPTSQPGPEEDCDTASDWTDSPLERGHGVTPYRELRRRMCAARGTYRWSGGRFARAH
jgi:hypothetical protein